MKKKIAINLYVLALFITFCTYTKTKSIYENNISNITPFQVDLDITTLKEEIKTNKEKELAFDLTNSSIELEPIYIEIPKNKYEKKVDLTDEYVDEILKQRAIAIQNRDKLNDLISKYSEQARGTRDENEIIKINNMRKILIKARDLYSSKVKGE